MQTALHDTPMVVVYRNPSGLTAANHATIYVMLDLTKRGRDAKQFVCSLEDWIIQTLGAFNVNNMELLQAIKFVEGND